MVDKTTEEEWKSKAGGLLKAHLAKKRIGYRELIDGLETLGVSETEDSISGKLTRGSFSLAFFLQCMKVLDVKTVDLSDL